MSSAHTGIKAFVRPSLRVGSQLVCFQILCIEVGTGCLVSRVRGTVFPTGKFLCCYQAGHCALSHLCKHAHSISFSSRSRHGVMRRSLTHDANTVACTDHTIPTPHHRSARCGLHWRGLPDLRSAFRILRSSKIDQSGHTTYEAVSVEPHMLIHHEPCSDILDMDERRITTNAKTRARNACEYSENQT